HRHESLHGVLVNHSRYNCHNGVLLCATDSCLRAYARRREQPMFTAYAYCGRIAFYSGSHQHSFEQFGLVADAKLVGGSRRGYPGPGQRATILSRCFANDAELRVRVETPLAAHCQSRELHYAETTTFGGRACAVPSKTGPPPKSKKAPRAALIALGAC